MMVDIIITHRGAPGFSAQCRGQSVGEGGAIGAEWNRSPAQKRFSAKFLWQGPKLIFRIQKSPYRGWHLLLGDRLAGTVSTSKAAYANYALREHGTR